MSSPTRIDLPDIAATRDLAGRLVNRAQCGDVFALVGDLGAGKTTFARFFIDAFAAVNGASAPDEVPSPTFTLVQQYDFDGATIYHFDLYRIEKAEEAYELGIEDAFADGISLIEWPDRLGGLLPASRLDIELLPGPAPSARIAVLSGHGAWADRLTDG